MVATGIAQARDTLRWFGAFAAVAGTGLVAAASRTRNPAFLAPLVPLSFAFAYQYDFAHGDKMKRIVAEAGDVLANEPHLVALPGPPLTVAALDAGIARGRGVKLDK